jgi:DNA repair photolyase
VRQLRDAGVNVGVLMAPVVPGFMTRPQQLEATVKAIADHGAAFVGANVMFLKEGTRDHFLGFIRSEFPHLVEGSRSSMPVRTRPRLRRLDPRDGVDAAEAIRPQPRGKEHTPRQR